MHLSDQDLLRILDGEEGPTAHLTECWTCRARKQELERSIAHFIRFRQGSLELPSVEGARAMLKAELAQIALRRPASNWRLGLAICALLIIGIAIAGLWQRTTYPSVVSVPDPRLTPGATVLLGPGDVCKATNLKNKTVPATLQKRVFEAYGITHPELRAYEVDYLITPALGGADDIHNLWPQSYENTVWNARVKDDLEDYLRALVCEGKLDLSTAQHDIAGNWIEAYKKYFRTSQPR